MTDTQDQQAAHWADKLSTAILGWQEKKSIPHLHVDDMKTPSGRVHTGALRGVILHDLVAKTLQEKTTQTIKNTYVFNDMDPMDSLPGYLDATEYQQHMGKPLFQIPVPPLEMCGIDLSQTSASELADFKAAKNIAELYALDFIHAFRKLGCDQTLVWSHELYQSGQMDEHIRTALNNVDILKQIYKEVADYALPEKWYPFQVICPTCGKVGTTLVTDWDGEKVKFECQKNKVEWAEGCGTISSISPFGGTGKLLWKTDWPAHWNKLGVTIEGAGKDHTSAGGSRDMANQIIEKVFHGVVPFNIPYEWILIRGAKMSSSKGVGTSAREFTNLFPPEIGRFLFVNKHFNQVIDFDPTTMGIPDLYDEYDQGARIFWKKEVGDERLGRSFALSQINGIPESLFLPRFRDIAIWMQYPEINLEDKFAEVKGSPLEETELSILQTRQKFAQNWIERYAPEEYRFLPTKEVPAIAKEELTSEQIAYLQTVNELLLDQKWEPQTLQQKLFDLAKETIGPRKAFQAIYLAYLGKTAGPRAAWLLLSMTEDYRDTRVQELQSSQTVSKNWQFETLSESSLFSIHRDVQDAYPSIVVGLAVIRGITIQKTHPELEKEKQALLQNLDGLTTDTLNQYPELLSYRKLYKATGIDWHSRRPSPEALLRRVAQGKDLYSINTCVDAYNLIVMKNRVSVGAFNYPNFSLPTRLQFAKGGEQILLLGDTEPTTLKPGELCYFDQEGPYNLDFNYRDAQRTSVTDQTTDILINIEGVFEISREQIEQSLEEVITIITKYCGGTVEMSGVVEAKL